MHKAVEFILANFTKLGSEERTFKNDKGETVKYDQLYLVIDNGGTERTYDIKLSDEAKAVSKSDARDAE